MCALLTVVVGMKARTRKQRRQKRRVKCLRLEAHVKHAVGLVENKEAGVGEAHAPPAPTSECKVLRRTIALYSSACECDAPENAQRCTVRMHTYLSARSFSRPGVAIKRSHPRDSSDSCRVATNAARGLCADQPRSAPQPVRRRQGVWFSSVRHSSVLRGGEVRCVGQTCCCMVPSPPNTPTVRSPDENVMRWPSSRI
jgi:hypothetical protein